MKDKGLPKWVSQVVVIFWCLLSLIIVIDVVMPDLINKPLADELHTESISEGDHQQRKFMDGLLEWGNRNLK